MSQEPLVSVCIANYNGMQVIDDCLCQDIAIHNLWGLSHEIFGTHTEYDAVDANIVEHF